MILVLGATGKIGSEVVALLLEKKAPVRVFVRDPKKAERWSGVEIAKGDLGDPASVAAALKGIDTLFLLTAAKPKEELEVVEAAKQAGVKRVVKISSLGAGMKNSGAIAAGHTESENAIKASGMAWTMLRPGMFAQNFLGFAPQIKKSGSFVASVKEGKISVVDTRDIAEVAVQALLDPQHDGKTYTLTGAESLTYADAAKTISAAAGKPVSYVDIPLEETKKGMLAHGIPAWFVEELAKFQERTAATTQPIISHDIEALLGKPPRTFEQFARDYAAAFK